MSNFHIRPWVIQNTLRTPKAARARLLGLCCLLLPVLLPSPASALSFPCWSPLVSFPRALFGLCLPALWSLVLAGACGSSCVVLVFPLGVACFLFCLVCLGSLCCSSLLVSLFCVFCFWWLLLTSYWTGTLVFFWLSPAQLRPYNWTCVSVRRLDRFTCAVDFHRLTMPLLSVIV